MIELFTVTSGSHLYGTNTDKSDVDMTCVYLPRIQDVLLGKKQKQFTARSDGSSNSSPISPGVFDIRMVSLVKFVHELLAGEAQALEVAFSLLSIPASREIIGARTVIERILDENADRIPINKMISFAKKVVKKNGSSKDYYHAFRLLYQAIEFHETQCIEFPLKERALLTAIKQGAEVDKELLQELFEKAKAYENEPLEPIDVDRVDSILVTFIRSVYSDFWL